MKKNKTIYYQKPEYICQDVDQKARIEDLFKGFGFKARNGTIRDTGNLDKFIRESYGIFPEEIVNDVSPYDIYRFSKFGNSIVLEDSDDKLIGCIFEIGYDTPDRTSYTIRLAIDPAIKGKNLGFLLTEYSCLLAMERGSLVKRGLMETDNITSCSILVNKMGWICDGFETDLKCGIDNGFTISLPLTPEGLMTNRIDNNKLLNYIKTGKAGLDYNLIETSSIDSLIKLYEKNDFWVVAVVRKGEITDTDQFFALPVEKLNIH